MDLLKALLLSQWPPKLLYVTQQQTMKPHRQEACHHKKHVITRSMLCSTCMPSGKALQHKHATSYG